MNNNFEHINKFIQDEQLDKENREVLSGFRSYLIENKPSIAKSYARDLFSQNRDFALLLQKPYLEVKTEDIEKFYKQCIGDKQLSKSTIDSYQNHLKALYEYIFRKNKDSERYFIIENTIKSVFKQRILETRKKLNEEDNLEKLKRVQRYLNEGIKRKQFKEGKFIGVELVRLSNEQRETLNKYYKRLRSGTYAKVGVYTLFSIFRTLFQFGEFVNKPYEEVTEDDFVNYFFKSQEKNMSVATINSYKLILKSFYTHFLNKSDLVKNIKPICVKIRKKEDEMLTQDEIKRMVEACCHPRDKAIIMVIYDAALRKGEVLGIQLKHIETDIYSYKITVTGKTGTRRIRIVDAAPYLRDWLNHHPFKQDKEAYLFINLKTYGRKLKENGVAQIVQRAANIADIKKRVYPHLLRHSKLNQLAKSGFNERDLRIFAGWSSESNMPDTYLHYGEEHVDAKILRLNGIYTDNNDKKLQEEKLKPIVCPRCDKIQPADAFYCNCGQVLNAKEAIKIDEKVKTETNKTFELLMEIAKNPELMKEFEAFKLKS